VRDARALDQAAGGLAVRVTGAGENVPKRPRLMAISLPQLSQYSILGSPLVSSESSGRGPE